MHIALIFCLIFFNLSQSTLIRISCRADLPAMNSFSFCLSENKIFECVDSFLSNFRVSSNILFYFPFVSFWDSHYVYVFMPNGVQKILRLGSFFFISIFLLFLRLSILNCSTLIFSDYLFCLL